MPHEDKMEREELLKILKELKAGYIALLNDLEILRNWGKVQLESLYATKIGKYEVELLELKILLKSLKKQIQWAHQSINIGQYPDFEALEIRAQELCKEAHQEIIAAKEKVLFGKAILSNLHSPEDSMELRKIYRNIAKKLHPDVNPNITEEEKEIWLSFYNAYQAGDLEKMKALEIVYSEHLQKSESHDDELNEDELLLQIAMLKQGIIELETQKKSIESEFPFTIAKEIRNDEWVAEQQDRLTTEIEEFRKAVEEKKEIYQILKETYER